MTLVNAASSEDYAVLLDQLDEFHAQDLVRVRDENSFEWLCSLAPATRGAIARQLVENWFVSIGLDAHQITDDHQRYVVVNDQRIQVKLSTVWSSGDFRFQQIRDQQYDFVLCLGMSPDDLQVWLIPKDEVLTHLRGRSGQHTGAGAAETFWLPVRPSRPEPWLDNFGDQLSDVREMLTEL